MSLGQRIKSLREQRGWTQEHLADICSVSSKTISRIELEKSLPSPETKLALSEAFQLNVYQLMYSSDTETLAHSSKHYVLEIYFENTCIEYRKSAKPFSIPNVNEELYIEFKNRNYSETYGCWWIVKKRRFLIFSEETHLETTQLYCQPSNTESL